MEQRITARVPQLVELGQTADPSVIEDARLRKLRLVPGSKSNKTSGNTHFLIFPVALLPRIAALALKQLLPLGYPAMPLSMALQALLRCCAIWLARPMILVWDSTIAT
jgi:hypothetical protein